MNRGCLIAAVAVALLCGVAGGISLYMWGYYNPVYHGKRLYDWADQARRAPDPAARREAVAVLRETLPDLRGEPRTQLLMHFAGPPPPLPPEMLPFLLDDLEADEHPDSYICLALSKVPAADTVPALIAVVRDSKNPLAREGAICALGKMRAQAREAVPVLREVALREQGTGPGRRAADALWQIDPEAAAKAGVFRD
jgi:HEAT repeat protein